jgi:hypothetical protein
MRTIIAGSRSITLYAVVKLAVARAPWTPTVVLSGTARGVDLLGERWAKTNGVPIERYPANWDKYGNRAGMIRNAEMVDKAEALIAVWDGLSGGTEFTIRLAQNMGLQVYIKRTRATQSLFR